ncbi:hypothetical protein OCH239_16285 [Roseivivax halodurans JCM 10272]|uniref:Ferrochelatase n=1 Tax=Roseivivax halodurans JCM 10272 TaxID=1449350 RepID=X7EHE5_9RHOB|nr:hypothetical protein [Roseivivax halodurans]ETX15499.1 hypothetical protein OCH239_16285 [Roseivivax halodurans JCM 10272]
MNTSIKALVAASASAMLIAAPAFAGGKGDVILEPEVAAEDVIVPAAPAMPSGTGVAVAAGVGALALAAALSGDDDDDDDSGTTTTPVDSDS